MLKMQPLAGVLALLLFLFFVNSCIGDTDHNTIEVFKDEVTEVHYTENEKTKTMIKPPEFKAPAFVGGVFKNKEFLAIISSGISQKSREVDSFEAVAKTSYGSSTQWSEAQMFTNVSNKSKTDTIIEGPTAVMNGNTIYVLVKSRVKHYTESTSWTDMLRDPLLIVGTVVNKEVQESDNVFIKWEEPRSIKYTFSKTVHGTEKTHFYGGLGNSIVTKSGTIMFPIFMVDKDPTITIASTLYSADNGLTWHIGGPTESRTALGSVVEWSDEKLLFTALSNEGYRKVFESEDKGITWKRSPVFFGVWGNNPTRSGEGSQGSVITVPVDGKDVLLFSHPLNTQQIGVSDTLQLWLSDGQRIVCIGTISDKEKEENTGNSILAYVDNHLYVTHQINPLGFSNPENNPLKEQWRKVIGFTSLPELFTKAKNTVHAWRRVDAELHTKDISTNGLVGFLGKTTDEKVWTDMYNCVNATVKGATSVDGGFRFDGAPGSGAQWPVASQGQNQVYKFTEKQFTLSATVIVHTAQETGEFLLIGASLDSEGNNVLLGLGYTQDNKWIVISDDTKEITTTNVFEKDKEYSVALTFANGAAFVYVDGVDITKKKLTILQTASISHFYMGGMQNATAEISSSCTVKNVMLFNRPLDKKTIAGFFQTAKDKDFNKPALTAEPTIVPKNGEPFSEKELQKAPDDV